MGTFVRLNSAARLQYFRCGSLKESITMDVIMDGFNQRLRVLVLCFLPVLPGSNPLITKAEVVTELQNVQGALLPLPPAQKVCKDECCHRASVYLSVYLYYLVDPAISYACLKD